MNLAVEDYKEIQKEKTFREAFFKCTSIEKGIADAAFKLDIGKDEAREYLMNFVPSTIDVYTLYLYGCRYKYLREAGVKAKTISQKYNYDRSCIRRAIKVVKTFAPNQITSTLAFSDYISAVGGENPPEALSDIQHSKITKRTKPFNVNRTYHRGLEGKVIYLEKSKQAAALRDEGKTLEQIAEAIGVNHSDASIMHRVGKLPYDLLEGPVSLNSIKKAVKMPNPSRYLTSLPPQIEFVIKAQAKITKENPKSDSKNTLNREKLRELAQEVLNLLDAENKLIEENKILNEKNKDLNDKNKVLKKENSDLKKQIFDLRFQMRRVEQMAQQALS